jgi:hypothetical protein
MWFIKSEERLADWKKFRLHLNGLSFEDAVKETVHLWSYAPFVQHHLDRIEVKSWPTPWELLSDDIYDDTAKCLGMIYTLHLSEHKNHSFELIKASNETSLENYNLVQVDNGLYILNYEFDTVITNLQLGKHIRFNQVLTPLDLQLSKY